MDEVRKPRRPQPRKVVRPKETMPSAISAKKLFIIFLFLTGQILFFYSDFFKLKEIKIYGNNKVSETEIIHTACIPMEKNIVTLPLAKFRQRLRTMHQIKDVDVKWSVPGKVNIFIQERTPAVLVRHKGSSSGWFTTDEKGMVLAQVKGSATNRLPRMVVKEPVEAGYPICEKFVSDVKTLDANIPAHRKKNIRYYMVEDMGEIIIVSERMGAPFKIMVGTIDNLKHKIKVMNACMDLIDDKNLAVDYLDIRYQQPFMRPMRGKEKFVNDKIINEDE